MARVFVAMSGGVDSSVAAALLLEGGHDVSGVTMQLKAPGDGYAGRRSSTAVRDAKGVCDLLGIPHYELDFHELFEREVVTPFARAYASGTTPNPCVVCNDRVKFSALLAEVSDRGAEYLATGHYVRIVRSSRGEPWLARGVDANKDQSYFLYRLTRAQMERVLFPVGELRKHDVRAMAERFGLHVADKSESQEACFAAGGVYDSVVAERAPQGFVPGDIVDTCGNVIGAHDGIAHFTVGQRKGMNIGGTGAPLYVVSIDSTRSRVVAGSRVDLAKHVVHAGTVVWHGEREREVTAAVRYRMEPVAARARVEAGRLTVEFEVPLEGVAPGQSVVCYSQDRVVGGGIIEWAA